MSIATDWKECEDALYSMSSVANLSHRFSNLIIGLHSTAVLFYGIGVVALRNNDIGDDAADRELFLKMELPFESSTSPIYEVVMITQFLHQMTAATVVGVLSALLVTLVSWGFGGFQSPRDFQVPEITPGNASRHLSSHYRDDCS